MGMRLLDNFSHPVCNVDQGTQIRGQNERAAILKVEPILAKLNELRKEAQGDPNDPEWLALYHAFCFISYKMGDFQKYLDEVEACQAPPTLGKND